jgi:hypothetical protein
MEEWANISFSKGEEIYFFLTDIKILVCYNCILSENLKFLFIGPESFVAMFCYPGWLAY